MKEIINFSAGENGKDFLQKKEVGVSYCGGKGTCGKCKVQILEGNAGEITKAEKVLLTQKERKENIRLLCQIMAKTDIKICINRKNNAEESKPFPNYFSHYYYIKQHSQELSKMQFGVAFDIGTTTVVGKLFDLEKKCPVMELSSWNPQACFGADIMTRMQYCLEQPNGIQYMQKKITDCLTKMLKVFQEIIGNLSKEKKEIPICYITIAGNSAMTHFLLGQKIDSLAKAPFVPFFTEGQEKDGRFLGLNANDTIYTLPLLKGQVGGDITAALLAIDIFSKPENTILLDLGTNGEIAFFQNGMIYVCSTAAGPALEGASISYGMRAEPGAIERIWLMGGNIYTKVIQNLPAQGICGSALIDAISVLLDLGKIHTNGYLEHGNFSLTHTERFNISITQEDIRQYQMVKGAIRAGIETLIHTRNIHLNDISQLYIAGSFGNNIQKQNAIKAGLLPEIPLEKIIVIGNASLEGASYVLLSKEAKQYVEKIRNATVFINLAEEKEFQKLYIKHMNFS